MVGVGHSLSRAMLMTSPNSTWHNIAWLTCMFIICMQQPVTKHH